MQAREDGHDLRLTCDLKASPTRVFTAMTDPVELTRWWGPHGFTTPTAEVDLTVGGRYRLTMQPPEGEPFHVSGEFLEIRPSRRLVYSFGWEEPTPDDRETVVALSLDEPPDPDRAGTRVSLLHGRFATAERLDLHRNGWTDALARLRQLLEQGPDAQEPSGS